MGQKLDSRLRGNDSASRELIPIGISPILQSPLLRRAELEFLLSRYPIELFSCLLLRGRLKSRSYEEGKYC